MSVRLVKSSDAADKYMCVEKTITNEEKEEFERGTECQAQKSDVWIDF